MKTLFGMTAAVLMVVMMLFVALPGEGLAEYPVEGGTCNLQEDKDITIIPRSLCCIDNKTIRICDKITWKCKRNIIAEFEY